MIKLKTYKVQSLKFIPQYWLVHCIHITKRSLISYRKSCAFISWKNNTRESECDLYEIPILISISFIIHVQISANVPSDLIEPLHDRNGMSIGQSASHHRGSSSGLCSSWVAGSSPRSGPHRINSGTLSYLLRGGYPWHTLFFWLLTLSASRSLSSTSARARCVVHGRSNVDDGMTDRGRVRVADTGRVIGRPPGGRPPSRGHEGRLVSQTQRALELTECSPWPTTATSRQCFSCASVYIDARDEYIVFALKSAL